MKLPSLNLLLGFFPHQVTTFFRRRSVCPPAWRIPPLDIFTVSTCTVWFLKSESDVQRILKWGWGVFGYTLWAPQSKEHRFAQCHTVKGRKHFLQAIRLIQKWLNHVQFIPVKAEEGHIFASSVQLGLNCMSKTKTLRTDLVVSKF